MPTKASRFPQCYTLPYRPFQRCARFYLLGRHFPNTMLLKHMVLLVAITASNVSAIANSQQTVDGINVLTKKTLATKQAIDNYNGGFTGALLVAKSIYTAHMTSENIRKNLDSSDPFDGEDGDRTMDAYNQFAPVLLDTLRAGQQKVRKRANYILELND